jgi:hypothetical protein
MLFGVLASGCATTTPSAEDGLRVDPSIVRPTAEEMRERADSARAQAVADEVGPRVTITADFDYAGGSRQVQARFHMYDDAYVVVGHLDAAGRMKIVFPSQPGDDGFVRGDKVYYVPTFFAGFADEYTWRYNEYRYRFHDASSRNDSYDAGLGYVFIIASWRPMRLDRISDGNRWQTYDVSDVNYMQDPREAIEELGSVIAGDNREAYTIQYAHYTTTNFGTYTLSDFDAVNSGCYGTLGFMGFAPRPLFLSPFFFGSPFAGPGCGSAYNSFGYPFGYYAYGYGYPAYGYPGAFPGLNGPPRIRPPVGTPPVGGPIFHRPNLPGVVASHKPEGQSVTPLAPMGGATPVNGSSAYRRPTIQDMVGHRRIDEGARAMGPRDAGIRDNTGWASRQPTWTNRGGGATVTSHPREEGGVSRNQGGRGFESPRGGSSYSPPARIAPSSGTPHYSQPAPSHAAPAARPSPPPSSSSGSRKP